MGENLFPTIVDINGDAESRTRTARPTNKWHPRGRNILREAWDYHSLKRAASRPAVPAVSLFVRDRTTNDFGFFSHAEDQGLNGNPELTDTRGIFFFSSCPKAAHLADCFSRSPVAEV
jgi:hypothetical protein